MKGANVQGRRLRGSFHHRFVDDRNKCLATEQATPRNHLRRNYAGRYGVRYRQEGEMDWCAPGARED